MLNMSDLADLLNVRLQTLGVAEHSFDIELCGSRYNWLMYDVGGAVRVCLFFLFYCFAQQGATFILAWPGEFMIFNDLSRSSV
jgi:hypothetical protein